MNDREAFEAWYEADAMPLEADWFRRDPHEADLYDLSGTSVAWRAWQAALASRPVIDDEIARLRQAVYRAHSVIQMVVTKGMLRADLNQFLADESEFRK